MLLLFLVGSRVSTERAVSRPSAVVLISTVSIVVPFVAGSAIGALLHPRFAPAGIGTIPFSMFIGAAMSMTAFPVLARILVERRLLDTPVGRTAIACAAFDDVIGWLMVAAILAPMRAATPRIVAGQVEGLILSLVVMWVVVRPVLAWSARGERVERRSAGAWGSGPTRSE